MNVVALVGRAGRDAEIKYLEPSGTAKANFSLALDRFGKDKDKGPVWVRVELWEKTAQIAADYVKKGSLVGVSGRLDVQKWKDAKTGDDRELMVVVAHDLRLLGKKEGGDSKPESGGGTQRTTDGDDYDGP